ncbi:hypothetical protein CHLRE_04g215100v5 [Chlamydomonas reinhardtii]|uniref:Uncharacterized protein n=1 Tax=Chlamydomonas reinhardtii TaxID=3055 RepID=A0A2K3DTS4_CHLRE|nr:uncharacterized protein CHLRE_04g215100v5 [Chlamydomonas reinhardtii]PNW83928.1 hypothetical protein CHLRE_04g215100v5 [Chlamydomonas reinhardtii]
MYGSSSAETRSLLTPGLRLGPPQRTPALALQRPTGSIATSTGPQRVAAAPAPSSHSGGVDRSLSCRAPSQPTLSHQVFKTPVKSASASSVHVDSLCTEFRSKTALRVPADRPAKDQPQLSGLATGVLKPRIRPGDDACWFSPPRGGRNLSRELRGLGVDSGFGGSEAAAEATRFAVPTTSAASTATTTFAAHPCSSYQSGGSSGGGGSAAWAASAGPGGSWQATPSTATATASAAAATSAAAAPGSAQLPVAVSAGAPPLVCGGGHRTHDTATSAVSHGGTGAGAGGGGGGGRSCSGGGCGGTAATSTSSHMSSGKVCPSASGATEASGGLSGGNNATGADSLAQPHCPPARAGGCGPAAVPVPAAATLVERDGVPAAASAAMPLNGITAPAAPSRGEAHTAPVGGVTAAAAAAAAGGTSSQRRVAAVASEAPAGSGAHRAASEGATHSYNGEHLAAPQQQQQQQALGSVKLFSPVKAGRAHREKLGTDVVLTPVRRSARTSQKPTTPIGALLEMTNFAFVNNSYLNAE